MPAAWLVSEPRCSTPRPCPLQWPLGWERILRGCTGTLHKRSDSNNEPLRQPCSGICHACSGPHLCICGCTGTHNRCPGPAALGTCKAAGWWSGWTWSTRPQHLGPWNWLDQWPESRFCSDSALRWHHRARSALPLRSSSAPDGAATRVRIVAAC